MDRYETAALMDFVATVIWPTRTPFIVTAPGGQQDFTVNAPAGGWATATDVAMAWINGQRVTGAITWLTPYSVRLPATVAYGKQVIILVQPGSGSGYLPRDGAVAMLDVLNMANFQIANLGASTEGHHAVRRDEVTGLVAQLVGGNFVAKAGDSMAGPLLGAAAGTLTAAGALVRRDMVALLNALSDAERTFLTKPMAPATVAGDPATTLATKGYAESLSGDGAVGNRFQLLPTPTGTDQNWTIPTAIRGPVLAWVSGAGGGRGGNASGSGGGIGGDGGPGAVVSVTLTGLTPGGTIPYRVGGAGGDGANRSGTTGGAGGGGGGATTLNGTVVAGGGGGGGGASTPSDNGGDGGGGGVAGTDSGGGGGGVSGGLTTNGGVGGTRGPGSGGNGNAGTAGTGTRGTYQPAPYNPPFDVRDFIASLGGQQSSPVRSAENGYILLSWRE